MIIKSVEPWYSSVLYDAPGKFGGWPSIAKTADGELLVVFSGDRKLHVDPYGKTLLVRSGDAGKSWSQPGIINDSPLDDRDPGIVVCPDGTWLVSLFTSRFFADWKDAVEYCGAAEVATWQPYVDRLTPVLCGRYLGNFTLLSQDRGTSWSSLRPAPVHGPHGPVVGPDGELLYLGSSAAGGTEQKIACFASHDLGENWCLRGFLSGADILPGIHLCEPHLVVLPGGSLLGQMRVNAADIEQRQLMQSISEDGGYSWGPVTSTGLWGLPPHLLWHSSGVLLSSYGHRRQPFGQRIAVSRDLGMSWREVLLLPALAYGAVTRAEDVGDIYYQIPDLGYPATVELDDGSLYTVWYQSNQSEPGAKVLGCRWTLPGID